MNVSAFSIVGIGASAGGLDAFHKFFDNLPTDTGMAFVMILHLPADRKSMLADILRRWTTLRVIEAVDGTLVKPNCVYVPPPHAIVTLVDDHLGVQMPEPSDLRVPRPIDAFFDSLGASMRERAVGIVLSGTGSDGALGLKAIKECGGLTIAQGSNGTAPQYGEMPAGAIATGSVDLVAPIEEIPGHLLRIKGIQLTSPDPSDQDHTDASRLRICAIIKANIGHDFSGYRDKTFLRRVQRRMQVVNAATLDEYVARLEIDHNEVVLLFRDLLIRVTSFFRDKETFATLESLVIPRLFENKYADGSVRVWVPGCSTGEEAYSLAILLCEHMGKLQIVPKVQVFATDIDEFAIGTARQGRYPATLLEGLSVERRERFFKPTLGGFGATKEIRDLCTFSAHNLIRDPPFSRMDLVSCRNLLIYMDTDLQAAVIPAFHYSLASGGILLLGGSESTSRHEALFEPLDRTARIFIKRNVKSPQLTLNLQTPNRKLQAPIMEGARLAVAKPAIRSATFENYPQGLVLENPSSSPAPSFWGDSMVALKSRIQKMLNVGIPHSVNEAWKQEFLKTQQELQSLSEQHQTALEELRSANEELHSVNEEMQSTNEELETSKEELQSVNEELHTVNGQLSDKVEELDGTNSDLRNLFESTEIATVFLDRHLIIRSFTPAIASLYALIPSDEGRPLTDIVSRLEYDTLLEDVATVLETLKALERRVAFKDQTTHYILRILPYRDPDSTVSGVLVTFIDVTSIVQAEAALREADLRKDVFLATLSHELRNPLAPIRSAAHLLESPNLEPVQSARAHAIIVRQVNHMSSLLDDLLDVSRITRGSFVLKKSRVDIKTLLETAVESVQPAMDKKRHTLRVEVPEIPIILDADPVRLTQVISNLLTNAAKYTPEGGLISVGGYLEDQDLVLFVRDNGVGIQPVMLTQVFNMFTQVEADGEGSEGGLGIGLALAKGLVQLHGGRIAAHSPGLGKGSEFTVSLPRSLILDLSSLTSELDARKRSPHVARRVLVADDNLDGAETLGMILQLAGHEVHLAHTGAAALEIAERVRPDAAVLDIGMPDLNGYEVAERIRLARWGAQVTLIALTGWGQDNDKRRALTAGFDHHCTKPVNPDDIERFLVPKQIPFLKPENAVVESVRNEATTDT